MIGCMGSKSKQDHWFLLYSSSEYEKLNFATLSPSVTEVTVSTDFSEIAFEFHTRWFPCFSDV